MKQIFKDENGSGASYYEQVKSVACSHASKWESSLQETVYHVMPELWQRKTFPGIVNANTNIPEKCVRIMLSKKESLEFPENSTNIYKYNIVSRYQISRYEDIVDILCYA